MLCSSDSLILRQEKTTHNCGNSFEFIAIVAMIVRSRKEDHRTRRASTLQDPARALRLNRQLSPAIVEKQVLAIRI